LIQKRILERQTFKTLSRNSTDDGYTQLIRFSDGEHYTEIKEDLDNLIKLDVHIESIITDGHKSVLKAIKKSLPDVIGQRCLMHVDVARRKKEEFIQMLNVR